MNWARRLGLVGMTAALACLLAIEVQARAVSGTNSGEGDRPVVEQTVTVPGEKGGSTGGGVNRKKVTSKEEYEARQKAVARYQRCADRAGTDLAELAKCRAILPPDMVRCVGGCEVVDPGAVAREVVARLELPDSTPMFGPDPQLNQVAPGTLVVKFPYWLTVPGEPTLSTTAAAQGLTLQLNAERTQVVFTMGNGATVTCAQTRAWPGPDRGIDRQGVPLESPVCGYRYPAAGQYTISAVASWEVTWSGAGQTGVIRLSHTSEVTQQVVEIHSVVR